MTDIADLPNEDHREISIPCVEVRQPIGVFFVGVISNKALQDISFFDVRRIINDERELETYLGIQRPLNLKRVDELKKYVNFVDASFPSGIILAVQSECAKYSADARTLTLTNYMDAADKKDRVFFRDIARVIDGQHRIAGLAGYEGGADDFQVAVTIFVGMDIADQAYVFSTVNLAQTKVSPSLAYDLYSLAKARSPQKTCHLIAIGLDKHEKSPFYKKIKRLGVATGGRFDETITQAAFIRELLPYISTSPLVDRDKLARGELLDRATSDNRRSLIFRNMFIYERDLQILDIVWNFFEAVSERWPEAWRTPDKGNILRRTSAFRALFRFMRPAYLEVTTKQDEVPPKEKFLEVFRRIKLEGPDFTAENYKPGSSGEALLFRHLMEQAGLK